MIEAVILGLVQGLTEFIPVSSSGHLLLAHELFGTNESSLAFDVALHVGTLLALLVYFRKDLVQLIVNVHKPTNEGRLARLLLLATLPAAVAGLLFSDIIDQHLRSPLVVAITLASVGVLMLIADRMAKPSTEDENVTTAQGLKIGFAQLFALIPGVSRSGATMTAGIFLGLSRQKAAKFSFLLAIPIIGGSALGILLKESSELSLGPELYLGMIVAFLSGLLAIKFLLGVIGRVGLMPFAIYRIILAVVVLIFVV